jgi:hypothetical protein
MIFSAGRFSPRGRFGIVGSGCPSISIWDRTAGAIPASRLLHSNGAVPLGMLDADALGRWPVRGNPPHSWIARVSAGQRRKRTFRVTAGAFRDRPCRSLDFDGCDTPMPQPGWSKGLPERNAGIRGGEDRRPRIPEERAGICHGGDRLLPTISTVEVAAVQLRRSRCGCSREGSSSSGSALADAAIALIERHLNGR